MGLWPPGVEYDPLTTHGVALRRNLKGSLSGHLSDNLRELKWPLEGQLEGAVSRLHGHVQRQPRLLEGRGFGVWGLGCRV